MKALILSIARAFLTKNIAFSIYRFPNTEDWVLAMDPKYYPFKKKKYFWMTPFHSERKNLEIILPVIEKGFINKDLLDMVKLLPEEAEVRKPLGQEMTKEEYEIHFKKFLDEIKNGRLNKIILSRIFYEEKAGTFDPFLCFEHLTQNNPKAFVHFSLHPNSGLWMGASPELLLEKKKELVHTMALAGTQSKRSDQHYHWREKEQEEHLMVSRHIERVFEKNGARLIQKLGPKNIETDSVVHLKTDYNFKIRESYSFKDLINNLHPTPAIAGLPRDASINCILQNEGYDRTYYCGIIGETDFDEKAQLFVNLRCMQIGEKDIAIYVGGGITAASDPEEEWQETVLKGETMRESICSIKVEKENDLIR